MKIRSWWGNQKLRNKFALSSIFIILVSTSLLAFSFFQYESNQLTSQEYLNEQDMSVQIGNYLDEKYKSMLQRVFALQSTDMFNNDSFLAKFLFGKDSYYHAAALSQLSGALSEIRMSEPFIQSVYIYTPKGDFYDLAKPRKPGVNFIDTALYKEIESRPESIYWGKNSPDELYSGSDRVIPVVIPFKVEGYEEYCYIIVNLDVQEMTDYLKTVYSRGEGSLVIINSRGDMLAGYFDQIAPAAIQNGKLLNAVKSSETGIFSLDEEKDQYIVAYHQTQVAPYRIVILKSRKVLTKSLDQVKSFLLLGTLISILLCIFVSLFISGGITKPLSALEEAMKKVSKRDFNVEFQCQYEDEVGQLGRNFNFMLRETKNLISRLNVTIHDLNEEKEKLREEQILKQKAELRALQEQINPHFLYNTLNSITWMADAVQAKEISQMAAKLGTMYQISLSGGKEFISFRKELEHVTSYLFIQKIRYGEKLNYSIQVSDEVMEKETFKLLLQPLVENSIRHGISETDRNGVVRIMGRLRRNRNEAEFFVIDNGAGIPPEMLADLHSRLRDRTNNGKGGYGIYNINERLKLHFGERYGLCLFSRWGKGTAARVIMPAVDSEGREEECSKS